MRRTVSLGIGVLVFVSWLAPLPARADDARQEPWESHARPGPAPEDVEESGARPQQRGIPETGREKDDATEGTSSRTVTPGAAKTTTTEDED